MNKPQLELADVVRRFVGPYKQQFGHLMLPSHHRALQDITRCMTEAMGGGRYHCHDCHETFWSYLARYVFRIAITNHRLMSMDETHVAFQYKDHDTGQWKTERLEGVQFLRRFLFHVLPKGFHKVRYYGLWHPCKRDRQGKARLRLELTAASVADTPVALVGDLADEALAQSSLQSRDHSVKCPKCGGTNVLRLKTIRRRKAERITWPMGEQ